MAGVEVLQKVNNNKGKLIYVAVILFVSTVLVLRDRKNIFGKRDTEYPLKKMNYKLPEKKDKK